MCVLYTYVVGYRPTVINFYASSIIQSSAKKVNDKHFRKITRLRSFHGPKVLVVTEAQSLHQSAV